MSLPILSVSIRSERDTVSVRQRARQIAKLLGFDVQDQTRISTAVSEVARNAFNYAGGGRVEYILEGRTAPQLFIIKVADNGPGIRDLDEVLEGRYQSTTGMGLGIVGARRLMDQFEVDSVAGKGTTIWLKKLLPKRAPVFKQADVGALCASIARERPQDSFQELQHQNRELLAALDEIRTRQIELTKLNRELEDTNRGVVALYAELDEKADHLRRADELKSRFLSNMSHEFRSPLNSILALSGLLLDRTDGDLSAEQHQQVAYVRQAAQDLLDLVNDLLDLARVEAGKEEAKPIEFEACNLFAGLRGMLRPLFLNQSLDLVFEDADEIPMVYSDEGKVSQILRNFISNALKFTEKGEVRISAGMPAPDQVRFTVSDTGIGIAPENLELIFQDFSQVDNPIQRRVKGTGLGLPLSRKLAKLLGGEVSVESKLGAGSKFSLQIPVKYQEMAPALVAVPEEWSRDQSGLPVLIVEDKPEMLAVYQSYLNGAGFQVLGVSTTREAEFILEKSRPAAIILDIVLRSENSWALLAKLKDDDRTTDIPVLVSSTTEDQAKGYHLGADGYLVKPIDKLGLIRELKLLTGQPPMSQILIIDDDERDRYLLKQQLKKMSVFVHEAAGGLEGLERACQIKPDVIFLDLGMTGMSGFHTLDKLKADPAVREIPVIVVSSQVLTEEERGRLMEKAIAILSKEGLDRSALAEHLRVTLNALGVPTPKLPPMQEDSSHARLRTFHPQR